MVIRYSDKQSYSFHSCVGALSYIYGPVKEAHWLSLPPLHPPHQPHPTSHIPGPRGGKCKSANPVCPRLPGLSHIRQSLDSAQLDQETMENFLWKLQRSASKALWTQAPLLKRSSPLFGFISQRPMF